jgi:hypothetical protein
VPYFAQFNGKLLDRLRKMKDEVQCSHYSGGISGKVIPLL